MNEFYKEVPLKYSDKLPPLAEGEVRGLGWSVAPIGDRYLLSFISGSLDGKEILIEIAEGDYRGLANGSLTIDAIQLKYDVG